MDAQIQYTFKEKVFLWVLAVFGFTFVNGAFLYGFFLQPEALDSAMRNPVSSAFIIESMVLMGFFSYLLARWKVSRLSWWWFILLSLAGSMAFALPIVLLWPGKTKMDG